MTKNFFKKLQTSGNVNPIAAVLATQSKIPRLKKTLSHPWCQTTQNVVDTSWEKFCYLHELFLLLRLMCEIDMETWSH